MTTTVYSSWGEVTCDSVTGEVLSADLQDGFQNVPTKFDMDEFRAHYPGDQVDSIDILDIGYWSGDLYIEPEEHFREEVAARAREEGVRVLR